MWKNLFRRLLGKPALSTYTPPPAPKRTARPAVTVTRAAGPSITLNLFNNLFTSHRHAAPTLAGRVQAARAKTAARQRVKRDPAPTPSSRPANAADILAWRKRVEAREAAVKYREQQVKAAEAAPKGKDKRPPEVIEGEVVKVKSHKRAGVKVDAHTRSKPED